MYSIVEFHDGIFAIPSIWLSADKKSCKWPPYDERKLLKAVSKQEKPMEHWESFSVTNIFGTAPDYDSAIHKVSLAEMLTDISDTEYAKATRKSRAHRVVTSDDSDNENHPAPKKFKQSRHIKRKAMKCNIYPEFPTVSGIATLPLTNIENNDNATLTKPDTESTTVQRKTLSVNIPFTKENITSIDHTFLTDNENLDNITDNATLTKPDTESTTVQRKKLPVNIPFTKKNIMSIDHTFLTDNEKLDYIIELLQLNIKKENIILTKINDLQARFQNWDELQLTKENKVDANDADDNIASLFPLKDVETLNSFEEKLQNKEFYKKVATKLYNQGGKNIDQSINRVMSLIFTNSLACNYSYLGKQKKKPFHNSFICKCVLDVISRHKFDVKEDYICKKIGYWLANAPTRQARERMKTEKSAIRDMKPVEEVLTGDEST